MYEKMKELFKPKLFVARVLNEYLSKVVNWVNRVNKVGYGLILYHFYVIHFLRKIFISLSEINWCDEKIDWSLDHENSYKIILKKLIKYHIWSKSVMKSHLTFFHEPCDELLLEKFFVLNTKLVLSSCSVPWICIALP